MASRIFLSDAYRNIQSRVRDLLNSHDEFLSPGTAHSTRAAGDAAERIITENFEAILGEWCSEYSADFARRAMADLAFRDLDGHYCVVDVKTHREDTRFNMPNLTSVRRLARFYEDDNNYFVVLIIKYRLEGTRANISQATFVPIEFLGWDCLTIGALGWGQIQIADANRIVVNPNCSRKQWMLQLCEAMLEFYPKEIEKINDRIRHFGSVREFWLAKPD